MKKCYTGLVLKWRRDAGDLWFWTGDADIRVQNTHPQVKAKILERMAEWTEMFASDPDLGIMHAAYMKLKTQSMSFLPKMRP